MGGVLLITRMGDQECHVARVEDRDVAERLAAELRDEPERWWLESVGSTMIESS